MPNTSIGFPYPSSSSPVDIQADIQALAEKLNAFTELPAEVESSYSGTVSVTSTGVFANLPSPGPLTANFTNPSSVYDLIVDVQCRVQVSINPIQDNGSQVAVVGVAASGGVTFAVNTAKDTVRMQYADFNTMQITFPLIIPAGSAATTFTVQAQKTLSSVQPILVADGVLRIKPRRFKSL